MFHFFIISETAPLTTGRRKLLLFMLLGPPRRTMRHHSETLHSDCVQT